MEKEKGKKKRQSIQQINTGNKETNSKKLNGNIYI